MSMLKRIVLFATLGAIVVAVGVITLVSYMNYQSYRSQFNKGDNAPIVEVMR